MDQRAAARHSFGLKLSSLAACRATPLPEATDHMTPLPVPNWSEILETVRHLKPTREGLEEFRLRISRAHDEFRNPRVLPDEVTKKDFQKVAHLIEQLTPIVERISVEIHDGEGLRNELAVLAYLKRYSERRMSAPRSRNRKPQVMFHFEVLRAWVVLGGKLSLSSNPVAGTVTGPLARYFSAVTNEVTNASLHSLRDAIRQHDEIMKELEDLVK